MLDCQFVNEVPLDKIDTGERRCTVDLPTNVYDAERKRFKPPKGAINKGVFSLEKGVCNSQFWLSISKDYGSIPVIDYLSPLYDSKRYDEKDRDLHIVIESYVIRALLSRKFSYGEICNMLSRSTAQLQAISMLATFPTWFQEELIKTQSSHKIEERVVKPLMAHADELIDQYFPKPRMRLEW